MTTTKATETEIQHSVASLGSWTVENGRLHREYKLHGSVQAFGFMAEAARLTERSAHRPGWLNVYNRVAADVSTNDAGGIASEDLHLAHGIEEFVIRR